MIDQFFAHPILNSPYQYPQRHWELDSQGQPTQAIIEKRRVAEFITPIPKPRKRKGADQQQLIFNEGKGLSTQEQLYDPTSIINLLRQEVSKWRSIPNPNLWQVTPGQPGYCNIGGNMNSAASGHFFARSKRLKQ